MDGRQEIVSPETMLPEDDVVYFLLRRLANGIWHAWQLSVTSDRTSARSTTFAGTTPGRFSRCFLEANAKQAMAAKLRTPTGRVLYAARKQIVEPVFGQIKHVRGCRKFLLRGRELVSAEWKLICLTHNLLKIWRQVASVY